MSSSNSGSIPTAVAGFLTQLAVALHKLRAYPDGHPLRRDAVESAFSLLTRVWSDRDRLRIGVARHQLVVDECSTDPAHFVIRDLAHRLHKAGLGAIGFDRNLELEGFAAALERLVAEPSPEAPSADAPPVSDIPSVEFSPVAYDALSLDDRAAPEQAPGEHLWQALAQVTGMPHFAEGAGGGSKPCDEGGPSDSLANAVLERMATPEARTVLATTIERLGRTARTLEGDEREAIDARLGALLAELPKNALGVLLDFDLKRPESIGRAVQAADWLPVSALLEVVENAARAEQQEVSTLLLRLLRKLAGLGGAAGAKPARSDTDFRAIVKGLLSDWTLADPNPASHTRVLDFLAGHDRPAMGNGAPTSEGLRLLQMALETEAVGDQVVEGVDLVLEAGQLGALIELLESAPAENPAAAPIWRRLAQPSVIARLLQDPAGDLVSLGKIAGRADGSVTPVLVDALFAAAAADRRREIMAILAGLGPQVPFAILQRLERVPAADRRGFLGLIAELPSLPPGFTARQYADSPDPLIRLEAFRLMLRNPDDRSDAVFAALADGDERVIRVAVDAALEQVPRAALSRLMLLLNNPKRSPELRARAIPILGQFDLPSVRQWLLEGLAVHRGWFRRVRLSPKSPIVLAKLRVLTAQWADHPDVALVRQLAEQSGDPEVIATFLERRAQ